MTITITKQGDKTIGILNGRLDTAASAQFAIDMQPLMDAASTHIVLDCTKLQFIASSGLRLLLSLRKETIAKGGDVTIVGATPEVKQVFTITGFMSLFIFA